MMNTQQIHPTLNWSSADIGSATLVHISPLFLCSRREITSTPNPNAVLDNSESASLGALQTQYIYIYIYICISINNGFPIGVLNSKQILHGGVPHFGELTS